MSGFKVRKVEPEKGFRVRKVTQSGDGVISDPEDPYAGAIDPTQEVPEELRGSNASDAAREKYRKYKGMGPVERTVRSGVEQTVRETATAASKIMSLPKRIHAKQQGYLDIGGELKMGEDGRSKLVPYKNKMEDYATEQSLKSSEAEQARMAASSGEGSETLQKYTTGAIRNIGQMAIANLLVPGASMAAGGSRIGAGVGGAIAGKTGAKVLGKVGAGLGGTMGGSLAFGGSRAVSAAREAQEAGLSYEETEKYVKTQVAAEVGIMSLFSAVGAGGLETGFSRSLTSGGARSFLKEIGLNIAGEVAEENITEFVQKVSAIKSGVDKGELTWEVAKGIFAETTMATLFTMGLMEGGRGAVGGARNANALSEMVKNVSEFYGIEPEKAKSILKIASRAETVDEYEQILGNELMLEMGVGDISELTDIAAREDTNLDNEGGSAGYSDIELERELQESKARWERERDAPTAAEPTAAEPTTTEPTPPAPILTQKGTPFQTRGGAVTAARRNGLDRDAVVEVEGGFVVQPPAVETAPTETQTSTEVPIQKPVDLVTGQVLENDDVQNRPLDERVSNDTVVPGEVQAETPAEAIAEPVGTPQAYKPLTATGNQDIATELAAAMPGATITPKGDNSGWTASFASGASVDIPLETNMPTDPLVIKKANPQMSLEQATKYARENKIAAAFVPKGVTIKLADGRTFTAERLTVIFDPRNKNSTTAAHEAIHIARELGFFDTPKGKNLWLSLEKKYRGANDTQTEENIAKARENWEGPGNLWEQILDFLNRIFSKIPGIELSARNAMAETFTPGFWNQQGIMNGEGGTDAAYQVSDNDQRASRVRTPTEVKERARAYLDKTPAPPRSSVPYYDNPDKGRKSKLELGKLQQAKEPLTPVNNNWQLGWSDSAKEEISQTLVHETMRALSENGSGLGWYDRVMAGAMREAKRVFPELRSQDTRAVFTAILSITSNGQKVGPQFRRSYNLFNGYLETEKIEENGSWGGERKVAINSHLQKLNTLLDVFGESGLREFLDSYTTVGQLNKWSRDIFGTNAISGEASDAVVRGAMIFGPKLGNFYANMNGDFSAVTMDLWFSRTIGRITGTYVVVNEEALGDAVAKFEEALEEADTPVPSDLTATLKLASDMVKLNDRRFQKGLDPIQTDEILAAKIVVGNLIGIKEAPSGGYERRQIREVVELTRQKLEAEGVSINAADLQAVLWYYEKQLVARNGGRAALGEANDYEQAAKQAGKTFKRRSGVRKWKRRVPTAAARRSIEQIQLEGAVTEAPTLGLPLPSRPVESQINLTSGTREAGKFLHKTVTENENGFTVATDGTPRTTGVTVAPLKVTEKNYNPKTFTPALATKWLKDNGSLLTTPGAHIGGWLNGKAKKYVIDMSIPMPTREDAVKVAIWADQDAIFDLSTGDTIDTKKDGKPVIPEGINLTVEQVMAEKPNDVLKWASGRYSDAEAARAMEEKLPKYQLAETQFDKYAQTEGTFKPKGPSEKGMLITHWSFKPGIKKTNPKKNGSGGQGREGRRAIDYPELWVPRTYFGFGDYKRESVIGGVRYGARINPDSLYDFTNDPLDLYPSREQLEEAGYASFDEPAGLSLFEQNIKKAGFAGMASDQGVGLLFYPLEVEQVAASDAPVAESEVELPKYQIADDQAPTEERKARVGLAFKDFFSDVTKGTFGKSEIPFVPNLDMTGSEQVITTLMKHSGNFSDHIFKSIPTFFEAQVGTAQAVSQLDDAKVLDIAGSEGSWGKTVTELSGGKVKTVTLDPNLDMRDTFRKTSKVQGATFAADAFLNGFKDGDRDVKAYKPKDRFDVIHESMGFQFIDNNRAEQITEVKRLMKPDGVFLTEQKLLNDEWEANEEFKNVNHKDKYFTEEELAKKDKRVGYTQSLAESEAVGMVDNMVSLEDYRTLLENEFEYVEMYWDSGNFKGFAASDSQENLQKVTGGIPDLTSEFSTGRGAMYQIADPAPVFYSPLARAVRGLNQGVFTPAQLKGTIQKLPGVKAEELEDLGFFDWLDGIDGKVTKDEVLAFIDAGGPKVEEVVKGNPTEEEKAKEERFNELEQRQRFVTNNPLTDEELQEYFELRDALGDESEGEVGTRYSQYQLPGGENYREMLLTLPETPSLPEGWSVKQTPSGQWGVYTPQGYRLDETYGTEAEATQRGIQEGGKQPSTKGYTSSHWNEPNVLAHVRLNDRTGPNGEKVLFVEEIQSDWHQEGRKKGYGEEWTWEVLEEGPLAIPIRVEEGLEMVDGVFDNEEDAIAFQRKYGGEIRKIKSQSGVPDAPFKKSWAMLAFKRVLRMAAEQGYDSVSWTPGEVQAERYDLSKQIDTLASWPEESATGEPMWGIQAVDENGTVQIERSVMESELEGVVGKEIAQRIIERDGETPSHDESVRELKGEGLKVGGEGMKGFYDNILPKEVQKYVKKMGGKVTTSKLQTGTSQKEIGSGDAEVMGTLGIDSQLGSSPDMQEVWTLPITDEMREEVMGGLPMYQIAGDTTDSYRPDFSVTSIQNDVIRELREMTGRDEIPGTDPETWLMWMEDASVTLAGDPREAERFIADIQENPRVLSPRESAMLTMIHRVAYNEYESVSNRQFKAHEVGDHTMSVKFHQDSVKILNWINEIEEASKRVGSFAGQALNARKIALRQDYSIEALVRKARTSQGGVNLTKDQMDELVEFANRIQDLESRLRQAELSNSDLRRRVDELLKAEVNRPHEKPKAHTRKARAKVKKKKALTDLKSIWEKNGFTFIDEVVVPDGKTASYQTEGTDGTAGPDTNPQFNPEELRPVALQLAEASLEEGAESFGEFWSQVGLHLGDRASLVEDVFRSAWETVTKGDVDPILNSKADITKEARRIQRVLVEEGFWNLDQVVEIVQKALADILPDTISTMEALSGYGQFSLPSQEEAAKIIRDHNAQLLQRVKLDKLKKGKVIAERMWAEGKTNDEIIAVLEEQDLMLKATGPQRDAPSDIVRALNTAVYEAKKAIPVSSKSRSGQLQTAMDSAKKAIGNRIKELDKAIKNGTPLPGRQSTLRADDELKQMRQERDELTRFYREMFPAKKTPITEEQRIEITDRAVTRAIIELERQLAEDDLGPKPKRPSPSSPALDAKRARLEELREQKKLILDARKPKMSPEERAEKTYMTNLKRRIAEYQEILENGDFSPRPKKQKRVLSKEELQMKTELETIRGQVWEKMEEYRLEHSSPAGKALYYAKETAHLSRAMMTSIDASAVFRQGGVAVFSNPLLAVQASKEMAKAFMSQDQEFLSIGKIREDDLGQFAEMVGLSITEDEGKITRQEEAFMGKWAKRVPLVAASGRGYSTFLNNMRFSLFKQIINHLSATGEVTIDEGKVIAKYINAATGRADLKAFNKAAANFNMVFFAPRWVASRFQYLTMPIWVLGSRNVTPRVKRAIAKEYGKTLIGMSTTIGLLLLAGHLLSDDDDEVRFEVNPLSTDFLKVRIGDTRLDPTAALGSTVVFSSRLIAGRTKTRKGDIKKFGEGYKPTTRATLLGQFMRYKMAPIPGAAWTVFDDMTDPVGQKVTPWGLAAGLFIPLSVREVVETSKAQNIPTATMLNALALLGMSIGTYGEQSEFLAADPEERAELFNKKLRTIQWDDPPTGYETELTRKQQQELDNARLRNAGLRAYQLTVEDDAGDPEKSKETRQKALDALRGYNRDLEAALEYYMEERGMRLSSSRRRRLREQMRRIED